jgi:hypothetical protein
VLVRDELHLRHECELGSQRRSTSASVYPPPPPPGGPAYNPQPPTTMPGFWDPPVIAATERILAQNPALDVDVTNAKEIAKEIARRCVWLAAQALIPVGDCGGPGLPMFVTGGNVMDVTRHDLNAIISRPGSWMKLNYDGIEKDRSWLLSDPRCQGETYQGSGMHCHEFPYNITEQGGQPGNPAIAPLPAGQNLSQGGTFGNGLKVTRCAMRPALSPGVRGDAFLVVPVPVTSVPTTWLCNGKSASSQPPQPPSVGG